MTAVEQHSEQLEDLIAYAVADYPHTRRSLQIETGVVEKTVRRWIEKAGVTGHKFGNVERFTNAHRDQILSHQSKPKADEVIEAELVEPGAIELHTGESSQAAPLMSFDLQSIQLTQPSLDTSALDAHTAQLEVVAQKGAQAIAHALTARFGAGIAQIVAKQDNLLRGIEAQALNGAAQSMQSTQRQNT